MMVMQEGFFLSFYKMKVQRYQSDSRCLVSQNLSNFLVASDQREVAGDPRAAQVHHQIKKNIYIQR